MAASRWRVFATTPLLVVADLKRSVAFYCDILGFQQPGYWGEPPCFAMINRDKFDLMLSLASSPEQIRPQGAIGVWDFHMRVSDVEAEREWITSRGVKLASEPRVTEYEMKEIEVLDPDGYRVCLGQDLVQRAEDRLWDLVRASPLFGNKPE
jgi:catechol 2,3-dioxygenase-like lactoylglutathione lyase family enzyme